MAGRTRKVVMNRVDLIRRATLGRLVDAAALAGGRAWRLVTSVRFAIVQIITLVFAGLIGTLVRQIPSGALHNPALYASEIADLHVRYDGLQIAGARVGPAMVATFEQLGFFRIFSAPWFVFLLTLLTVSIVCGTLNRLPRLWREVTRVQLVQADGFYDLRLAHRAEVDARLHRPDQLVVALRRRHFRVSGRDGVCDDGGLPAVHLYGVRNQYAKLSTLLTHAGLVLFLIGALVTATLGFQTIVFVGNGETAPVQPVGTPHNLVLRNAAFEAPRLPSGAFADFRTDLEIYQDGKLIARKTIRVNDPLQLDGFTFHQNTFGPSARMSIRGADRTLLWTGSVVLAGALLGRPQGFLNVPGSQLGLVLLLDQTIGRAAQVVIEGVGPPGADGSLTLAFVTALTVGESTSAADTAGYSITFDGPDTWSGISVNKDPGENLIWFAFAALLAGLALTFYFPRRRIWLHLEDGRLQVAMLADRYVDLDREFDDVVRALEAAVAQVTLTTA